MNGFQVIECCGQGMLNKKRMYAGCSYRECFRMRIERTGVIINPMLLKKSHSSHNINEKEENNVRL